ncbi:CHAT domain-containing tetratricopeptide repeat protein [Scytonema sp. PCC 10023]|uniref:CHAT domain-containing tetratricopeptide repeat protein n=1 Tax=Scytonema sp. PCC 10023 TaxID=1680591 RepID=UPI0039C6596A
MELKDVQTTKAEADQLLQQGIEQYNSGQSSAAIQCWQQALTIYREIEEYQGEADALETLADVYYDLKDYVNAIEFYQQYLALARELGDKHKQQVAWDSLGNAYYSLEENTQAIESFQQSLMIIQNLQNPQEEVKTLNKLGLAYAALKRYSEAIDYYQQGLVIAGEFQYRQEEGWLLDGLGEACCGLNNYSQAIECYQQSLAIAQEIKNRQDEAWVLENLGQAYNFSDNYVQAIESYQQCLAIVEELQASSPQQRHLHRMQGNVLCQLGMVYDLIGEHTATVECYLQSLVIAQELQDLEMEAQSLKLLGDAYNIGLYDEGIEHLQRSLVIAQQLHDREWEGEALASLGVTYYFKANYTQAIEFSQQSLIIAREFHNYRLERKALTTLGNTYDDLQNHEQAIEYYQQALALTRMLRELVSEAGLLNNLGMSFFRSGDLERAEQVLRDGITIWDSIRAQLGDRDTYKVSIFDTQAKTYRSLQEVLIAQGKTNTALEVAEQGRTRALVDFLTNRFLPETVSQASSNFLTIEQIKQIAIAQKSTLVEYSFIYHSLKGKEQPKYRSSALLIWVIQPTGDVTFRSVDITFLKRQNTPLSELVEITRDSIGVRGRDAIRVTKNEPRTTTNQRLQQLYQILIEPIVDLLPTEPDTHVIFIPQSSLFLIPFSALCDSSNKYLIEKYTIRIVPSIQVLSITQKLSGLFAQQKENFRQDLALGNALVVGNPIMPKISLKIGQPPQSLRPLPGAEREAKAIAPLLNTQPIIGEDATKVAVLHKMLKAQIIHLATHGLLDDFHEIGTPGAIALSPSGEDDGLLTAGEILKLQLNAELVVLSACDTGRGRLTGDGVIGLSRSLILAGVPSMIVSLWAVPDAPTAELMTEFYQNLERGFDKASALRQAMLTTMKQHPNNPKNWAAFSLIGEA